MGLSAYDIERLITKYFQEMRMMPNPPSPAVTYQTPQVPVDLTPVADAIREGFTSIATAIEYVGQLEDKRYRDHNKQEEPVSKQDNSAKKAYKLFNNASGPYE